MRQSPDGDARVFLFVCRTLVEIRDQHDVAIQVASGNHQLLPIAGPDEVPDQLTLEVSQLLCRTSAERLFPDVAHAPTRQYVLQSTPISGPTEYLHPCRSLKRMKVLSVRRGYSGKN